MYLVSRAKRVQVFLQLAIGIVVVTLVFALPIVVPRMLRFDIGRVFQALGWVMHAAGVALGAAVALAVTVPRARDIQSGEITTATFRRLSSIDALDALWFTLMIIAAFWIFAGAWQHATSPLQPTAGHSVLTVYLQFVRTSLEWLLYAYAYYALAVTLIPWCFVWGRRSLMLLIPLVVINVLCSLLFSLVIGFAVATGYSVLWDGIVAARGVSLGGRVRSIGGGRSRRRVMFPTWYHPRRRATRRHECSVCAGCHVVCPSSRRRAHAVGPVLRSSLHRADSGKNSGGMTDGAKCEGAGSSLYS